MRYAKRSLSELAAEEVKAMLIAQGLPYSEDSRQRGHTCHSNARLLLLLASSACFRLLSLAFACFRLLEVERDDEPTFQECAPS